MDHAAEFPILVVMTECGTTVFSISHLCAKSTLLFSNFRLHCYAISLGVMKALMSKRVIYSLVLTGEQLSEYIILSAIY